MFSIVNVYVRALVVLVAIYSKSDVLVLLHQKLYQAVSILTRLQINRRKRVLELSKCLI